MSIEQNPDVIARAAHHAALSDPARVRIVDLLTPGDLSPSELQLALGMPSNLIAHHLRVLEDEGMVARHRSEADRRRSYIRLVPETFDGFRLARLAAPTRVLFVCTANSARSQLASALWQKASSIPVTSAGTHPGADVAPGAIMAAQRHGLDFQGARPQLLADVEDPGDLVISVCDSAYEELEGAAALHWSIPDPVRIGTDAAFDAAFDSLAERIGELVPRLTTSR
jgi:protein-tyrosine-phosphatase